MDKNNNERNEEIIYEALVKYGLFKSNVLLSLTNKDIALQKKKGLFKREYKVIDNIVIDNIKVVGDKVKVESKKNNLKIYTNQKQYELVFDTAKEAKKLAGLVKKLRTGSNLLERTSKNIVKFSGAAVKSVTAVGVAADAVARTYKTVKENKDTIVKAAKVAKSLLTKS